MEPEPERGTLEPGTRNRTIPAVRLAKILAVQAVIAVVLVEAGLRLYNPLPFRVRGDRIVLPVHRKYSFSHEQTTKLEPITSHTKNALGFRGPDPPRDFSRRLTLVTIGGSTTECLFLSDGKTWTDVLARRLARTWPDVWVNNAGLDGQSSYGHLILLRDLIVSLKPKVAVFLVGVNDIEREDLTTYDQSLAPNWTWWEKAGVLVEDHSEVVSLAHNLLRMARTSYRGFGHSEVDLTKLTVLEHDDRVTARTLSQQDGPVRRYADRLNAIVELSRANGIEPVFTTQPALYGDAIDPATRVDLSHVQVRGAINGRLQWRVLELYNEAMRRVARDRGVLLVDAATEMPKDSRRYYDLMHFTNEGAARLGEIIGNRLEPYLQAHTEVVGRVARN
jgi:lysophospholipase L1-like esterase